MKKFEFPLSRVLDWRRTEAQIEESKLEQLFAELRGIEAREVTVRAELARSESVVRAAPALMGAELAVLDAFKRAAAQERLELQNAAALCQGKIARQAEVVTGKRREVKLLERLHQRKFDAWKVEFSREIDRQAEELHLARLR